MKVNVYEKKRVFDEFFKIDEAKLQYERFDGSMTPVLTRLCFERGDSVAAVLFNTEENHVVLVEQFRYPAFEKGPGWITELVAGMIAGDESPEETMRQELLEETGYRAGNLEHIGTFYPSPGGSSERIVLFYAEVTNADRIGRGGGLPAEGEDIRLVHLSLKEVEQKLSARQIVDAKTIIGLMWLQQHASGSP